MKGKSEAWSFTGKKEKITITNDKGRLTQEEIDRMVAEAEEYAEQDKAVKAKIDARNKLETYCYNMKQTLSDKLGDKLEEDDKETVSLAYQAENLIRASQPLFYYQKFEHYVPNKMFRIVYSQREFIGFLQT